MEYALALVLLAALVALAVSGPLRRAEGPPAGEGSSRQDQRRAELEAAKEAKYREIRDAELDFRTGKLSQDDYRVTDRELRAQAIAILKELDQVSAQLGDDPSAERGDDPSAERGDAPSAERGDGRSAERGDDPSAERVDHSSRGGIDEPSAER